MKLQYTKQNKGYLLLETVIITAIAVSLSIAVIQTAFYFQKTVKKDFQTAKNIQNINKFCKTLRKILAMYKKEKITAKPEINFLSIFKKEKKIIYITYTNKTLKIYHKEKPKIFKWEGKKILFTPYCIKEKLSYIEIVFKSKYKTVKKTIFLN